MSADDNGPEQAREVEVVARAVRAVPIGPLGPNTHHLAATDTFVTTQTEADEIAQAILAALEPIRAAERQEAAREATQEAWTEAAGLLDALHVSARAIGGTAGQLDGIRGARLALLDVLDDLRADGVTGRSET